MAAHWVVLCLAFISTSLALPIEDVIAKLDPGPRYQYMVGPNGPELVDLWLKRSDLEVSARYNPDTDNNFHLFTRSNPTVSQPIPYGANNILSASNFDANKKTVFIVHGWRNTPLSDFNVNMVHAYIAAEDVNLIMVDWSVGAAGNYLPALLNVPRSGEQVARFINWLNEASGASLDNYHLIGHSLGGHQVGIIGRNLDGKVPYITSLDPALPGWITNRHTFRATDGIYTEVMHTDVGLSGYLSPIGDVDFYPNGGTGMTGCNSHNCNHHRCIFYMAESLMYGGFTGQRCSSLLAALRGACSSSEQLQMGGKTPNTGSSGIYHVNTNAEFPFSQG